MRFSGRTWTVLQKFFFFEHSVFGFTHPCSFLNDQKKVMQLSLMCSDPISSLHAQRSLIPAEEVSAFFSPVLNCFLYCHFCQPRFYFFVHPGDSTSSSLLAVQVVLHHREGMILHCPRGKMGTGEGARDTQGTRKNPAAGLEVLNLP